MGIFLCELFWCGGQAFSRDPGVSSCTFYKLEYFPFLELSDANVSSVKPLGVGHFSTKPGSPSSTLSGKNCQILTEGCVLTAAEQRSVKTSQSGAFLAHSHRFRGNVFNRNVIFRQREGAHQGQAKEACSRSDKTFCQKQPGHNEEEWASVAILPRLPCPYVADCLELNACQKHLFFVRKLGETE